MVDFSQLRVPSAEERETQRVASLEAAYAKEDAERDLGSKRALTITLVEEPRSRSKPDGTEVVVFRGVEDGRAQDKPMVALYEVPFRTSNEPDARDGFDKTMRSLGGGDRLSVAGSWAKRGWNGPEGRVETWEFKARHFAPGDVPLEDMLARNRGVRRDAEPTVDRSAEAAPAKPVDPARAVEASRRMGDQFGR